MPSRFQTRLLQPNASVIAATITGLAFFLRVYRLADNNIWWDEGWTIWLSRHDLAWIALRTASDEHPPLHYWLMHVWNLIAGMDPTAVAPTQAQAFIGRFASLFFGVLTVALTFRLGRKIGGNALGLIAAMLLALARFHIWWSQDIKNYTLSGFFALASVWFALEIVGSQAAARGERPNVGTLERFNATAWIGYVLSITLALYSHYLAALILVAENLFVFIILAWEWRRGRPRGEGQPLRVAPTLRWVAAQIAVLFLYAPWLALYLQNAATWTAAPAFDFGLFLRLAATVFPLGVTTYIDNYTWVVLGFTVLAALAVTWLAVSGQPSVVSRLGSQRLRVPASARLVSSPIVLGTLFFLLIVLVPVLLIYLLSLTPAAVFAPKIQARYLLILLPAYMLLTALGILFLMRFSRYVAGGALVLVAAAQMFTLNDYLHQRVLHDDYFTLANVINSFALPGDAVVLDTDQEWPTFLYYLRQPLPWVGVPNGTGVDRASAQRVAAQARQYHAVWMVTIPDALAQDQGHLIESELALDWPKQYEQTFGDKRLTLYASQVRNVKDVPPQNFAPQSAPTIGFDSRLILGGVDLPVKEAQAGDTVRVVTYWASQDLAEVHIGLQGPGGATIASQTIPISIGAHERAEADLTIPPDAPATGFAVIAQARLGREQIGRIDVLPRAIETSRAVPTRALNYRFGSSIHLVGVDLPRAQFTAGDPSTGSAVPLTLFWKTDAAPATSYTAFVHLLGAQYNPALGNFLWGQVDTVPVQGRLPTSAWAPGQMIVDPYALPVAPNAPRGLYKIEAGLYDAATGARLSVFDPNGQDVGDAVVVGQIEIK